MLEHIDFKTFKEKVMDIDPNKNMKFKGELPTIIDFSAIWCYPCKMLTPILEKLQKEYEGKINIYKVDVDEEEEMSLLFNIRNVPSLLFCKNENPPQMNVGTLPEFKLKKIIEETLL